MKKILAVIIAMLMLILSACANDPASSTDVISESVPADYGIAIEYAEAEFRSVFAEFQALEITDTVTAVRVDDINTLIVQFTYTSQNGNGVYGFEVQKDENGNVEILRQGEHVTMNALVDGLGK